jgi:hypothetical protein
MAEYYLLDLERTVSTGRVFYWKGNRHGYTDSLKFAGIFTEDFAKRIVGRDRDQRTVMIDTRVIQKILGKDLQEHEGSTT